MKNKFIKSLLVLVILVFSACEDKKDNPSVASSTAQVKFTLTSTKGEKITIEKYDFMILSNQLENKVVLINFWAPWCSPCIKEMPVLVELQEKYKDDLIIIGILFDEKSSMKEVQAVLNKFKVNFPITIGKENYAIAKAFNDVTMIPESYLYGKDGLFIEKFIGEVNKDKLEKYINNENKK